MPDTQRIDEFYKKMITGNDNDSWIAIIREDALIQILHDIGFTDEEVEMFMKEQCNTEVRRWMEEDIA